MGIHARHRHTSRVFLTILPPNLLPVTSRDRQTCQARQARKRQISFGPFPLPQNPPAIIESRVNNLPPSTSHLARHASTLRPTTRALLLHLSQSTLRLSSSHAAEGRWVLQRSSVKDAALPKPLSSARAPDSSAPSDHCGGGARARWDHSRGGARLGSSLQRRHRAV